MRPANRLSWASSMACWTTCGSKTPAPGFPVSPGSPCDAEALAIDTVAVLESGDPAAALPQPPGIDVPAPPKGLTKLGALLADISRPAVRHLKNSGGWEDPAAVPRTVTIADALMRRLRMSRRERTVVGVLLTSLHRPAAVAAAECAGKPIARAATRFFMAAGELVPAALQLSLARRRCLERSTADFEASLRSLLKIYETGYRIRLRHPPLLSGNALMAALRLPPGPALGRLLAVLREHQLAGTIKTPAEALAMARRSCAALLSK